MHPIIFDHIWKRYRLGSKHDSLRDAIPALLKRWVSRNGRNGHEGQPGEFWALKDVSFEVRKGETLGVIGPNGAGKSTVLKLLSRISKQTSGELRVSGRLAALIEIGAGFHPDLTGRENIYLNGTIMGLRRKQIDRLFDSIVEFSELEQFLETPVKRYSSGMSVRLGFSIAAHIRPENLLIDEVLAVGDLSFQQKCFKRIAQLKESGTTMIFISHDLEAVQTLCDRALLLRAGQLRHLGSPADIVQRYREEVFADSPKTPATPLHADGVLQIRHVALRDATGSEVETRETGQPLRIDIGYRAARPIRQPMFRVSIERLDGLLCHATSSRQSGAAMKTLEGEGIVTLEYAALNLLPNLYQVSVEVFEDGNLIPLAEVRQGRSFQITSDHREQGAVHLEHRWSAAC